MKTALRPVSKDRPCTVCGKAHKCSRGDDGLLMCGRCSGDIPGFIHLGPSKGDEQFHLYRREGDPKLSEGNGHQERRSEPARKPAVDWLARAQGYARDLPLDRRVELAGALGLPAQTLGCVLLGWYEVEGCWTFPEQNGSGCVVGILRRFPDGTKKAMAGGARGLILPDGWRERAGPVFCVEGPSDVLALSALGLAAVGRPSNLGGIEDLAEVLRDLPPDRQIIVVAEYDPNDKGQWPGRDGAVSTASRLSAALGREVYWVLPPRGAKDVRKWLNDQSPILTDEKVLRALGERLTGDLMARCKAAAPTPSGSGSSPIGDRTETEPLGGAFAEPIPASLLQVNQKAARWLWEGCIAHGGLTLFSALWKTGKTTLLSHLLKFCEQGGAFCGREVKPAKVLYVTEENESRWADRRDALALTDNVYFQVRPFLAKPRISEWTAFLNHLWELQQKGAADLIVFDTLANLWPVKDENNAAEVQAALMPLHRLTDTAALLLVHHLRKGDGAEATGSRGSGALPAFVDTILELRRYDAGSRGDRKRVLTGYGRYDETPDELVIELREDGSGYEAHGDRQSVVREAIKDALLRSLPTGSPGWTTEEIVENWPTSPPPGRQKLLAELRRGAEASPPDWHREGEGKKGSPYTFWVGPPVERHSVSILPLYRGNTETEPENDGEARHHDCPQPAPPESAARPRSAPPTAPADRRPGRRGCRPGCRR